jgi:hypothetical protein
LKLHEHLGQKCIFWNIMFARFEVLIAVCKLIGACFDRYTYTSLVLSPSVVTLHLNRTLKQMKGLIKKDWNQVSQTFKKNRKCTYRCRKQATSQLQSSCLHKGELQKWDTSFAVRTWIFFTQLRFAAGNRWTDIPRIWYWLVLSTRVRTFQTIGYLPIHMPTWHQYEFYVISQYKFFISCEIYLWKVKVACNLSEV